MDQANPPMPRVQLLREAFADKQSSTPYDFASDYVSYFAALRSRKLRQKEPSRPAGSLFWQRFTKQQRAAMAIRAAKIRKDREARRDLRDVVLAKMHVLCPDLTLHDIRVLSGRQIKIFRAELARTAGRAGHRGRDISRYLGISESRVSSLLRDLDGRPPSNFSR